MRYLVVIERGPTSYGAYSPDVPGCYAVGDTPEEVTALLSEALEGHVELMRADGDPLPEPVHQAAYVEVTPRIPA